MADWGAKVSKRVYSVYSPDHKQVLHSGFPFMKIAKQGTETLAKGTNQSSVSVTITHSLGYIPLVYVFGQRVTSETGTVSSSFRIYPFRETFFLHMYLFYTYEVTTTQLIVTFAVPDETFYALAISLNFSYFICYDPAT